MATRARSGNKGYGGQQGPGLATMERLDNIGLAWHQELGWTTKARPGNK